jgi:hypothetical protein
VPFDTVSDEAAERYFANELKLSVDPEFRSRGK